MLFIKKNIGIMLILIALMSMCGMNIVHYSELSQVWLLVLFIAALPGMFVAAMQTVKMTK